jgi:hypothetical protein
MQYLLDFIHEHTLERELTFELDGPTGVLELRWRAEFPEHWRIRARSSKGAGARVSRTKLVQHLVARGADLRALKRELQAILGAQIAFADRVLRDAALGREHQARFALGQRRFFAALETALERLTEPALVVVPGGGAQTKTREGHLSLVR